MGFLDWLLSRPKKETVYTPLDADVQKQNKAMAQELAVLKAQIARIKAFEKKEQEAEKDKDEEQEIIRDLNEQKRKIDLEDTGDTISLVKFILRAFKLSINGQIIPKIKIELTDKDDNEVFSQLGDIQISSESGNLLLVDMHGNPLIQGDSLDSVIWKPATIGNQLKRNRLALPRDKEFNPVLDVEEMMIPDVMYDESSNSWKHTAEYQKKAIDLLISERMKTRSVQLENERLEKALLEDKRLITELEKTLRVYSTNSQVGQAELSKVLAQNLQMIANFHDYQARITTMNQKKLTAEEMKENAEKINAELRTKVENIDSSSVKEIAKEEFFDEGERWKELLPEKTPVNVPTEQKDMRMPNPGDNLGARRDIPSQQQKGSGQNG